MTWDEVKEEQARMGEPQKIEQPESETWCVCELMGRVRFAGRLSEVERYGGKLARLDIPQGDGFVTKLFGFVAVWCITFVTEAVARHMMATKGLCDSPEPVHEWDFPKALNSPAETLKTAPAPGRDRSLDLDDDDSDLEEYDPNDPDMPK